MVIVAMEVAQKLLQWVERKERRARGRIRGRRELVGRLPGTGLTTCLKFGGEQ